MALFHGVVLLVSLALSCSGKRTGLKEYISHKFEADPEYPLLHIARNDKDGKIYLSAVNRLYQLDKDMDFSKTIQVMTGPVNDSAECLPYGTSCDPAAKLTRQNNYNKLLIPDVARNRLLVCGSVYQGICEARALGDIRNIVSEDRCRNATCITAEFSRMSCLGENCTTIAVIAEGPTVYNPVLYVATTVTKSLFRYDEDLSSMSTRSLHIDPTRENKLFFLTVEGIRKKSYAQHVDEATLEKYFKYGFATDGVDGFVYFLFQKKGTDGGPMTTVIARICKKDVFYYSYIEMPLTCKETPQDQNGELVDAFYQKTVGLTDFTLERTSEGALYVLYKRSARTSLCIYTIADLNKHFDDTIIACYSYLGKNGTDGEVIVTGSAECSAVYLEPNTDRTLDDDVLRADIGPQLAYYPKFKIEKGSIRCGAAYLPKGIERKPEVLSTWAYHQDGVRASGLTVELVDGGINVAYIGTEEGKIIELDVNHKNNYNTINIGEPILSDLLLDNEASLPVPHLYVMTSSKVFHIKVSICEQHSSCAECIGARDPYCGWCILESRCMLLSSGCSNGWLKPLSEQCIEASQLQPSERTLEENVTTKVTLLPRLSPDESYQCLFDGQRRTPAYVDPNDHEIIVCKAPKSNELPVSFEGEDHVNVSLRILYNTDIVVVSTTATFYECKAHGSSINRLRPCGSCLDSVWSGKCSWCVKSHTCVPIASRSENCLLSSENCPKVTSAAAGSKLFPVGVASEIVVDVQNLPDSATDLTCSVHIKDGDYFTSSAEPVNDSRTQVRCQSKIYDYQTEETEISANVTVFWKPNFNLDIDAQAYDIVSFYNCNFKDCSLCVTSSKEYNCGWCGGKCSVQKLCDKTWVRDPRQCPAPEIKSFSPTSGPLAGNTFVTIFGKNMGVEASDVDAISVAGRPCEIQEDLYKVSNEIVCRTSAATQKLNGKISITVRGRTETSTDDFHYRNPALQYLKIREGPVSGGIVISIIGKDLDTGLNKEASIGSYPCSVQLPLRSSSEIECKTSAASAPTSNMTLTVRFDGFPVVLTEAFSYIKDPEIVSYTTASEKLASFLAGGRDIIFTGKRLHLVQDAKLIAHVSRELMSQNLGNLKRRRRGLRSLKSLVQRLLSGRRRKRSTEYESLYSTCSVVNETRMICPSPKVSLTYGDNYTKNVSESMFSEASLRLVMDNVNQSLKQKLKYYLNPVIENLDPDESKQYQNGSLLRIEVRNLNSDAIQDSEIIVMIGDRRCPVDSINEKGSMHCKLPPKPEGEEATFPATVRMGNKEWPVGKVTYFVAPPAISKPLRIVLIIIGIGLVIGGAVLAWFFFNKQKHYKENKNEFQKVIENLEMSVRADFRKAFAELSTDMTDLTADIGDVGLPILNYRQYATNMFFPSVRYHPCMVEPDSTQLPIPAIQKGFVQFDLLITNKQFLMSFIRTLEQQRHFSNRDKGNVASLITVVLHKKLDYFTEVMKSLIAELVVTSVQKNPKLVLRRTESVAERMFSNWLAICLFPFIRDTAGKPLFLLQKAIKHQVSKGALDAVTGKTRYTLSDDSLLKEDVPCDTLTLFVAQSENPSDEPIIVKVLSCDSISQVKEKIMDAVYKRIPFSHRPKAEQLDLEWRHGRSGHLILPGSDYANEPGSRWRRVMTIKDYKVENNATMALIKRQQNNDDIVNQFGSQAPEAPMLQEENMRTYHLVKYNDDIEQKRESTILRDKHQHILDLYLLRLINMKGILQSYVDEVFQAILDTRSVPPAVKHFFDFLDELAKNNGIDDLEILHIWKTNGVLGRFWVMILKSPEAVFDIDKPESVESSMAVISQTFIDACSVQEHKPTKDSPINKQLYAKEIPAYKKLVQDYYQNVREMQPVSDQDMSAHMTEISRSHSLEFDVHAAHNELWGYVSKYYEEIHETLSNDPNATQMVIQRLQQAYTLIDSSINNP